MSRNLDSKIESVLEKRQYLDKELQEIKTKNIMPDDLFQKMSEFCMKRYADYPIVSKKCEQFLQDFADYQPLYGLYHSIETDEETVTVKDLQVFQLKIEEFETNVSKNKTYQFAILKMKELVWKKKVSLIEKALSNGHSSDIKITFDEVLELIQQFNIVNGGQHNESSLKLFAFLNELAGKINTATTEIKRSTSIEQLDEHFKKANDQFKGIVDLASVYDSKKNELPQNISANKDSLLMPIPLSMSFLSQPLHHSPISHKLASSEKKGDPSKLSMDIEPQQPDRSSDILQPIRIHNKNIMTNLPPEKPIESDTTKNNSGSVSKSILPTPVKGSGVLVVFESENKTKATSDNQETKMASDIGNNEATGEPEVVKKVKDNEGGEIIAERSDSRKEAKITMKTMIKEMMTRKTMRLKKGK